MILVIIFHYCNRHLHMHIFAYRSKYFLGINSQIWICWIGTYAIMILIHYYKLSPKGSKDLNFHQTMSGNSHSPYPRQLLVLPFLSFFLSFTAWHFFDYKQTEYLFTYLLALCIPSFVTQLFFAHFVIGTFNLFPNSF